jgi:hypothetical protein
MPCSLVFRSWLAVRTASAFTSRSSTSCATACQSFGSQATFRRPADSDKRDPQWRPFDPAHDPHMHWGSEGDGELWRASGLDVCLYYWRDDYWLLPKNES